MGNSRLVSIIIRTHHRPELLEQALTSLTNQTFTDFEVIVVEDGESQSADIIAKFPELLIHYEATGLPVGRVKAANIGLERSQGKFLNFLDDDDILLPHHIETLIGGFNDNPEVGVVYASSIERRVRYNSKPPYQVLKTVDIEKYNEPLDHDQIFFRNFFPIQAAMFRRSLYEQHGGMDESLEYLEDWDLWIKYSLQTSFCFIDRVTSIYYVPYNNRVRKERHAVLLNYTSVIKEKYFEEIKVRNIHELNRIKKLWFRVQRVGARNTLKRLWKHLV